MSRKKDAAPMSPCKCGCGKTVRKAFASGHNTNKHKVFSDRFFSNIKIAESCWLWVGSLDEYGYGRTSINHKDILAHRASWELHNGPVPSGMCVLHKCDNPPCVNPAHLFLGTHADNVKDKMKKHRQPRGEMMASAKLGERDVVEIFLDNTKSQKELSILFGVSQQSISGIKNGNRWGWLTATFSRFWRA